MKKKISLIVLIAVFAICSAFMIACDNKNNTIFKDYVRKDVPVETVDVDEEAGVTFDGVFDEDFWDGLNWMEMQSTESHRTGVNKGRDDIEDCSVRAVLKLTDKGIYVAMETDEKVAYVGDNNLSNLDVFLKTGLSVYIAADDLTSITQGAFETGVSIDGNVGFKKYIFGNYLNYPQLGVLSGVSIKTSSENLNGDIDGYGIEYFMPWSILGFEEKPEKVRATFAIIRYAKEDKTNRMWEFLVDGASWDNPQTWPRFDETGRYIPPEGENFGNHGDRFYTDGFDLSTDTGENPYVVSTAGSDAKLYIKDFEDTVMYAETTVSISEIYNEDQFPKVGFMFAGAPTELNGETHSRSVMAMFDVTADGKTIRSLYTTESKLDMFSSWDWSSPKIMTVNNSFGVQAGEAKLAVYRNGSKFHYFMNDIYVGEMTYDYIDDNTLTYAAILSFNVGATYSDYTFLTGEEAAAKGEEMVASAQPAHYTIDGIEGDWTDYDGRVIGTWAYDGSGKEFTVKAILKDDGLYFLTKAKHGLYLSGQEKITHNSSIEVQITTQNGTSSQDMFVTPDSATLLTAVMKTTDSGVEGSPTRYTSVVEAFLPISILRSMDAIEDGKVRMGFAWRTGLGDETVGSEKYPTEDDFDPAEYEVIKSLGRNAQKPYIWHPVDSAPWDAANRSYIGEEGITFSGKGTERTIDGDISDWAGYTGQVVRTVGVGEDKGYGFETLFYKGDAGLYFFTTANHRKYMFNDSDRGQMTNFVLETGISSMDNTTYVSGTKQMFFTPIGCVGQGDGVDYVMKTTGNDSDGYTTFVEGFIPNDRLYNADAQRFDQTTGLAKEGYSLRIGAAWRTRDDSIRTQHRGSNNYWQPADIEGWDVKNMYWLDEDGIRTAPIKGTQFDVDGDAGDWADVSALYTQTGNDPTLSADQQRSVVNKVAYRDDGLYILSSAKTYKYTESNFNATVSNNGNAFRNTSVEVQLNALDNTSNQLWFAPYANVYTREINSACIVVPETVTVNGQQRTRYTVTYEIFIPNVVLNRLIKASDVNAATPDSVKLCVIFTNVSAQGDSGLSSDPINGGEVTATTSAFYGSWSKTEVYKA